MTSCFKGVTSWHRVPFFALDGAIFKSHRVSGLGKKHRKWHPPVFGFGGAKGAIFLWDLRCEWPGGCKPKLGVLGQIYCIVGSKVWSVALVALHPKCDLEHGPAPVCWVWGWGSLLSPKGDLAVSSGERCGATPDCQLAKVASYGSFRIPICGWRLAVGGWRLAVGGWRLAVGGWRLAVGNGISEPFSAPSRERPSSVRSGRRG